jgi:protein involved in polysaccharide export with SLBB domain
MRIRLDSASALLFSLKAGAVGIASVLAIAFALPPDACGQTVEASQSPGSSAVAPVASFLNRDPSHPVANPQNSSPTAVMVPQSVTAPSGYQLSVDDQIGVEVFGEDDLRTAARVNAEGAVSLPLLGSVKLSGLTLNQAASRLTELYGRDYLVNPKVNVTLLSYAKRRFTVLGQVNRPGSYEMPEGSPSGIDLLEAIAIAGGYTRIAAPERISIKRRDQVLRVDAKKIARRGGSESGFRVLPGDTITVGESLF